MFVCVVIEINPSLIHTKTPTTMFERNYGDKERVLFKTVLSCLLTGKCWLTCFSRRDCSVFNRTPKTNDTMMSFEIPHMQWLLHLAFSYLLRLSNLTAGPAQFEKVASLVASLKKCHFGHFYIRE